MNTRIIFAGLAGAIAFFLLGWLIYGMLLADVYAGLTGVDMPPPHLPLIFVGNLFWAFMMAIIFNRWATVSTAAGGLRVGAFLGFFIAAGFSFTMLGASNQGNIYSVLLDIVSNTIIFAVVGAIVGAILGRGDNR